MERKAVELQRMKNFCLALLLSCVAMSIILEVLAPQSRHLAIIFCKGAFEAAVVGAMADWYAVVALFRHPLGISSLPHTAIIPRKKDDIGVNLGKFVQNEFMDDTVVIAKIREFNPVEKLFQWLEKSERDYVISSFIRNMIVSLLADKSSTYIHEFAKQSLMKFIHETNTANVLAQAIELLNNDKNRNDILNNILDWSSNYIASQKAGWVDQVKENGYWGLNIIGVPYVEKFIEAVQEKLLEIRNHELHEFRADIRVKIGSFIYQLQNDQHTIDAVNAFKNDLVSNAKFLDFIHSAVTHAKEKLMADLNSDDSYIVENVHQGILALVQKYRIDNEFNQYLNDTMNSFVQWLLRHKGKIAEHLSDQVKRWTPDSISQKLELEIGKDLQWIRVSGTLVGGLVGGIFSTLLHFIHS